MWYDVVDTQTSASNESSCKLVQAVTFQRPTMQSNLSEFPSAAEKK